MIRKFLAVLLLTTLLIPLAHFRMVTVESVIAADGDDCAAADPSTGPDTDVDDDETDPEVTATATEAEAASKAKIDTMNKAKTSAIETRDARESDRRNAENSLKEAQKALSDAKAGGAADTAQLEEEVKTQQAAYNTSKSNLDAANTKVTEATDKLESTPEMKKKRLKDSYQGIIDGNKQKGEALKAKANTGTKEEKEVTAQQVGANCNYTKLLEAKRDLELCQLDNPACGDQPALQKKVNDVSADLRKQIGELTLREETINRGMNIKVSEIFKPAGQAAKKLSFLQVTNKIADWMITLVSSLAVTALIIGGFMMIISGGAEERLEMGKTIFTYSLIGLAVTLMAYGIIATIQSLFI